MPPSSLKSLDIVKFILELKQLKKFNKKIKFSDYVDEINYIAIRLLENMGIIEPKQNLIDYAESILVSVVKNKNFNSTEDMKKIIIEFQEKLYLVCVKHYLIQSRLSKREIECLLMTFQGCTTTSIAEKLNITKQTVVIYRRRSKNKLGTNSLYQLLMSCVLHVNQMLDDSLI